MINEIYKKSTLQLKNFLWHKKNILNTFVEVKFARKNYNFIIKN